MLFAYQRGSYHGLDNKSLQLKFHSLNGSFVEELQGEEGSHTGEPLSPYLFVITKKVFSRMMNKANIEAKGSKFHPKCERLQLSHLSFADDLKPIKII